MKKYYLVPAGIIESNFPDDLPKLLKSCMVVETNQTIEKMREKQKDGEEGFIMTIKQF